MKLARPLADAGDVNAQFAIGLMLYAGLGVSADPNEGLRLIKLAAEAGVADAQAALATVLLDGKTAAVDFGAAKAWAEKAIAQNAWSGHYVLSAIYMNGLGVSQDSQTGLDHLRQAAAGNVHARYELGKALLMGRGTSRDEATGTTLLKQVAAADAQFADNVALVLAKTDQLRQLQKGETRLTCTSFGCALSAGSNAKRLRAYMDGYNWAELAAAVLDIGESTDLNYFYLGRALDGLGNYQAAKQYYRFALDPRLYGRSCAALFNNCQGSVFPRDIEERVAAVYEAERNAILRLERQNVERLALERARAEAVAKAAEDQRLADQALALAALITKAANGDREAQYRLAQYHFNGIGGVVIDAAAGIIWLTKAADGGFADAQFQMAQRLLSGKDINVDERRAESLLRKAAIQEHPQAAAAIAKLEADRQLRATLAEQARQAKERERAAAMAAAERRAKEEKAEAERRAKEEKAEAERKRREENAEKLKAL